MAKARGDIEGAQRCFVEAKATLKATGALEGMVGKELLLELAVRRCRMLLKYVHVVGRPEHALAC